MAALSVPIPMTPRVFYSNIALPQNKAKLAQIAKKYYKEIKLNFNVYNYLCTVRKCYTFTTPNKHNADGNLF